MNDNYKEYEFTLSDNSKRYEFVDTSQGLKQIEQFRKMHGAVKATPVQSGSN